MAESYTPPEARFDSRKHTQFAKDRALALVDQGKFKEAIDSMVSDLSKDPSRSAQMGMVAMMAMSERNNPNLDARSAREFIVGFAD